MSRILITAKISPDLDGVACAYAYAELLNQIDKNNEYIAGVYGEAYIEAHYLLERFNIKEGIIFNPKNKFDKFILVDASDIKGMPEVIREEDVIEVIDHRKIHQAPDIFPNAKVQVEMVGAAATLIFEKFKENKIMLSLNSRYLLLGAIYSNTLNFKSSIVNERDRDAVKNLKNECEIKLPDNLIEEMFLYKSNYIEKNLEKTMISDFKSFDNGLDIAQLEAYEMEKIVNKKLLLIREVLMKLKEENNLKYIFLTVADIKNAHNIFVVVDEKTKLLLEKSLNLTFNDDMVSYNGELLLRKQIMPLLIRQEEI